MNGKGPSIVVVVCATFVLSLLIAGYFYLDVREQAPTAITALLVQLPTALAALLAYVKSSRAASSSQEAAHNSNSALHTTSYVAQRALGELPADKASAIVNDAREVAATSPGDEPPRATMA